MKAAIVTEAGQTPRYADFQAPSVDAGEHRVKVAAAALSHLTKSRASGSHYSSSGDFPLLAGVDGTGMLDDGRRVYFVLPRKPYGSMADFAVVRQSQCIVLPDALDEVTAAAIAIPGMSSWAALVERARLVKGQTVLVNGATGTSGRLAVQIAKHLGAGKVIATGRNAQALQSLSGLGADATVSLSQDQGTLKRQLEEHFREGVDVVLDYLWGDSAHAILISAAKATPDAVPIRFVQIGAISGAEIKLPSAVLRSTAIELMGSGMGSIPMPRLFEAIKGVFAATVPSHFEIATQTVPLSQVAEHWADADSRARIVFTP
jgi:NADPH:quinone reductase-like Zn-dependent oxidoreductase